MEREGRKLHSAFSIHPLGQHCLARSRNSPARKSSPCQEKGIRVSNQLPQVFWAMHKYHFDFTPPKPAKLRQRWLGTRKKSQGYQDHHSLSCSSKDFNFKAFSTEKKKQVPQLPRITHRFHQLWPHRCLSSPAHSCPSPSLLLPLPCPTQEPRTHPSHQSTPLAARLQDAAWTPVADLGRHMPAKGRTSSSALACHRHRSSAPTVPRMPGADYAATEAGPPQLPVGGH